MRRARGAVSRAISRVGRDEQADGLIRLHEAARILGASTNAVRRWVVRGYAGLHLDAVSRGGEWLTSRAACLRFLRGLYELDDAGSGWVGRGLF